MTTSVTRRRLLELSLGAGLGAAFGSLGTALPARAAGRPGDDTRPVSMAMHIHACFSEGRASMQSQLEEAERNGIDVLWWTEHDFRMTGRGYRQAVRFEGLSEFEDDLEWTWHSHTEGPVQGADGAFVSDEHSPDESGRALRLRVHGPAQDWGLLQYEGKAQNSRYTTCLADTVLELDVLTESTGPDAEVVVEIESSYRPATGGRPDGVYSLQYRVGEGGRRTTEQQGLLGVVPVKAERGWQRLRLQPVADIAELWPDLVAGDSGLYRLRVGVRARSGATAQAVVDRLRFVRQRRDEALGMQQELIRAYAGRYPRVQQHAAAELSLVRHLNMFGGRAVLPDYPAGRSGKDDALDAAVAMTAWAHSQGALVSYNHPLGGFGGDPQALAAALITTRSLGADAIEIGCPQDVERLTTAYDIAARNSVFVTATGVTDNHSGQPWSTHPVRWMTSAWARSTEEPDLTEALGAGRAWFWDLGRWSGTLDLAARGRPAMGGVLVAPADKVPVDVFASDLPSDGVLEIVTGRVDNAGPGVLQPATQTRRIPAWQVGGDGCTVLLEPGGGSYVRAAVRDGHGDLVGFSNPFWVLPDAPPHGIPERRRL